MTTKHSIIILLYLAYQLGKSEANHNQGLTKGQYEKLLADARRLPFVERELADLKGYLRSCNKLAESKAFSKGKWGAGVLRPTEV